MEDQVCLLIYVRRRRNFLVLGKTTESTCSLITVKDRTLISSSSVSFIFAPSSRSIEIQSSYPLSVAKCRHEEKKYISSPLFWIVNLKFDEKGFTTSIYLPSQFPMVLIVNIPHVLYLNKSTISSLEDC